MTNNNIIASSTPAPVQLPEGFSCCVCCGQCIYLDRTDSDSFNQYYCGVMGHYYPAGSGACGSFESR